MYMNKILFIYLFILLIINHHIYIYSGKDHIIRESWSILKRPAHVTPICIALTNCPYSEIKKIVFIKFFRHKLSVFNQESNYLNYSVHKEMFSQCENI